MTSPINSFDAIMILGGGLSAAGALPEYVVARLSRGLEIEQEGQLTANGCFLCLSAGTPHLPPPCDAHGHPLWESTAAANWLIEHGVIPRHIRLETSSWDTIGNAWFSRILLVEPLRARRLCVITSEFHMPRARAVFESIFGLQRPEEPLTAGYAITFEATPNVGLTEMDLASRGDREARQLERWVETRQRFQNLYDFIDWMYSEHQLYSAGLPIERASGAVLHTYQQ